MMDELVRKGSFSLSWTKDSGDWEGFMRWVYWHRMERRIWYGAESFDGEWERFLREWMQVRGDFFLGMYDGGHVGAVWVTDHVLETRTAKVHLCTFPAFAWLTGKVAGECFRAVLGFGLDKRAFMPYEYLEGDTPIEGVARSARRRGIGNYSVVPGYFDGKDSYRITISRENFNGRWRRTETTGSPEAAARPGTPAGKGFEGCVNGSPRRT